MEEFQLDIDDVPGTTDRLIEHIFVSARGLNRMRTGLSADLLAGMDQRSLAVAFTKLEEATMWLEHAKFNARKARIHG